MLFRITQDLFTAFVFSGLLYFSVLQNVCCHLYLTANAKYRQSYRSKRLKFLLVLLFPSAHSNTSTPSLALVFLISMLFHLSSLPHSPCSSLLFLILVFQLHLISFQLLCSDLLFSKIPDKKVLKKKIKKIKSFS